MLTMWPILLTLALPVREVQSEIATDEVVVFYPAYARRTDDGQNSREYPRFDFRAGGEFSPAHRLDQFDPTWNRPGE